TALLSGITLDTKNFVLRTGSRTFEAAAYLRSRGANTITVKGFFGISMDNQKLRSEVVSKAEIHKNCAISFADINSSEIRIISAQAADELLSVENIDASFVFFKTDDIINISARSMGIINVQIIMEALGGGGHQTMAAAQLIGTTTDKALKMLVDAIDKYYESI
ncbi:MAG: DHHA1 domain-containing protein, partial [Oscillospiraceae bacterium]